MPTVDQVSLNRIGTLSRLIVGDRIVYQPADGGCCPECWWWEEPPQLGRPRPWLSTLHWLRSRGLVVEGLAPKNSTYRGINILFVATPTAVVECDRLQRAALARRVGGGGA